MVHIISNKDVRYQDFFAESLDEISSVISDVTSIAIVAIGKDTEEIYSNDYEWTPTTAHMLACVIQQDATEAIIDERLGFDGAY